VWSAVPSTCVILRNRPLGRCDARGVNYDAGMLHSISSRRQGADRSGPVPRSLSQVGSWRLGAVTALLFMASVGLGGLVAAHEASTFDRYWLQAGAAWRTAQPGVTALMRDVSSLGGTVALTLVTVMAVGYLTLIGAWRRAVVLAGAALSGMLLVSQLKNGFSRLRPAAVDADMALASFSFPSGHACMSAVIFLMLGAWGACQRERQAERVYIGVMAAVMTLLIGVSRVVLGVHWATDVLGGWAFGAAWALAWLLLARLKGWR
jgi:undecaprenyl-diphosphatase